MISIPLTPTKHTPSSTNLCLSTAQFDPQVLPKSPQMAKTHWLLEFCVRKWAMPTFSLSRVYDPSQTFNPRLSASAPSILLACFLASQLV